MSLTVSHLAAEVGLRAATVRYYERLGLLAAPTRTAAGYRQYDAEAVQRLRFIKGAQRVGLRLREIGELLAIRDQGLCPCGRTEALLRKRLAEIDAQVAESQGVRGAGPHGRPVPGPGLPRHDHRPLVVRAAVRRASKEVSRWPAPSAAAPATSAPARPAAPASAESG